MQEQCNKPDISTSLLHMPQAAGTFGATTAPVFQTSAFAHSTAQELENIFAGKTPGFSYSRLGNPTLEAFQRMMAAAEGGFSATACASGSAAVAMTLLNILSSGDEIIAAAGLYGGTLDFFKDIEAFGIKTVLLEDITYEAISAAVTERTKAIFAEVISNPGLKVLDIQEAARAAHDHELPLIVDATTITPILARPAELGADIILHSSSKYINGSGSAISGVIVDAGSYKWTAEKFPVMGKHLRFGKAAFTARLRDTVWRNIGACLAPANAFLNITGLETLQLRMERICENALSLARHFQETGVSVNYPGLPGSAEYAKVQKQLKNGMAGGILTIRTGSKAAAFQVIDALKYALNVSNIGDTKTLVVHPHSTIFIHSTEEEKQAAGVYDDMIRISVGIENIRDIINDFDRALKEAK
ncbi:MAG: O-acetylhomoserine aminocarboxypropyltransferase/cysteine synthase [Clostridia bacterium]|nr:O-acetylhomoserine aminocarboxypropyltransferase/cysteine synthase [Clostridia bacterium]